MVLCQASEERLYYINKYKTIAQEEMERTGVPASIKLAQAILESNGGKSVLSRKANNHFGIKCGGEWKGKTFYRIDDDKDKNGKPVASCFRVYKNPESSFMAHSEFLRGNPRYAFLFDFEHDDYRKWAHGLKKAGYATNPKYPALLIKIIENYSLDQFDNLFLPADAPMLASTDDAVFMEETIRQRDIDSRKAASKGKSRVKISKVNDIDIVYANANDTPEAIAAKTDVSLKRIMKYNERLLETDQTLLEKTAIFLQPKRKAFRGRKKFHKVKEGESIADISQKYGIREDKLLCRNRLSETEEPLAGAILKIRGSKVDQSLRIPTRETGIAEKNSKEGKNKAVDKYATSISDFEAPPSVSGEERPTIKKNTFGIEKLRKKKSKRNNEVIEIKPHKVTKRPAFAEEKPVYRAPISSGNYDTASGSSNAEFKVEAAPSIVTKPSIPAIREVKVTSTVPSSTVPSSTVPSSIVTSSTIPSSSNTSSSNTTYSQASSQQPIANSITKYHTIVKGETLYRLSKMYSKSVDYIKQVNNLSSNTLSIGQKLIVN